MNIDRSLRLRAVRRNTLTACLVAALAAGGAGAAARAHYAANPRPAHANSSEALFGAFRSLREGGSWNGALKATRAIDGPPMQLPDITVQNCEDAGAGSLRQAFADAVDGDVIGFSDTLNCSMITLTSGAIVATVPNLSVLGPGRDALTVDVDANNPSRAFVADNGLSISDLTISHGRTMNGVGGCIRVISGGLTLTRSTVTGCQSGDGSNAKSWGAGVDVIGNLYMQSSTISTSTATASDAAYGGGAFVSGNAYLDDSIIEGNTATATTSSARGGGLFASGFVAAYSSHLVNNAVDSTDGTAYGGGIFSANFVKAISSTVSGNTVHSENQYGLGGGVHGEVEVVLTASTLSDNKVSSNSCAGCVNMGGGASSRGQIRATSSTVSDNHVISASDSAAGGGLATFASGNAGLIYLLNSTVSGNSVSGGGSGSGYGGGIAATFSSPFIAVNSTVAFNQASHFGGGAIGNVEGSNAPRLISTIVANNEAPIGVANDLAPGFPFSSFEVLGSNDLVMAVSGGITFANLPLQVDPLLQVTLAYNGGPTRTHALDAGSPAINAGSNTESLIHDQRGCPYARESDGAADIGAFEVQVGTSDYIFGDGFDGVLLCP